MHTVSSQFSTWVGGFLFVSAEEDKHAERYFPKKPPLSVLCHKEIQQTSVCSQPSDWVFEELHTHRYSQSGAKTDTLTFTGDKHSCTNVVTLRVGFIKQCSGLNFTVHSYHKHPQNAEFIYYALLNQAVGMALWMATSFCLTLSWSAMEFYIFGCTPCLVQISKYSIAYTLN